MSINRIKPFGIYEVVYDLQYVELYSGGDIDPMIDAEIYAREHLAFDENGDRLPFSLQVGLSAQYLDRDKYMLEDMDKKVVRCTQRLTITIFVWESLMDYDFYESGDTNFGEIV